MKKSEGEKGQPALNHVPNPNRDTQLYPEPNYDQINTMAANFSLVELDHD